MQKTIRRVAAAALAAVLLTVFAAAATPSAGAASYHGVDIYHGTSENGQINWPALKQTQDFVYIKADEGENWVDPMYRANVAAAKSVGLKWGTYHFLRLYSADSARRQADNYWARIKGTGYDLIPAVDVESYDGQTTAAGMRAIIRAFVDEFRSVSGIAPVLYTYTSYANDILRGQFTDCRLWLADYRGYAGDVVGWGAWHVWQYSEHGSIAAIVNNEVDLDKATAGIFLTGVPAATAAPAVQGSQTVLIIQRQLNDTGIARPKLVEDGIIGAKTRAAIRVLEQVAGIRVDAGVWGPQCVGAITAIYARPTLQYGSRGLVTRYLQYRLGLPIDGIFGRQTQAAVVRRQQAVGLATDGIVGPRTWPHIGG